ncbi:class I SAM-dependent methyltransferase [Micromonospora sp. NPDC002296]|uniref:class I SAM-dependent methyltransferase n=1 Tax=Micromonospora sp. NPDC002296 TaxID=3154271 RepID=UPI0033217BE5
MTIQRAHQQIREVILAAAGSDEQIRSVIGEVGPARVAAQLADELVARADLHDVPGVAATPIVVRLALEHDGATVEHHIRVGKRTEHSPVTTEEPHATLETSLAHLLRAVFGPYRGDEGRSLRIRWHDIEAPERLGAAMHVFQVMRRLVGAVAGGPADLAELSLRNGSDKWGLHYYTPHYTRHFGPLRHQPLVVLELGIGGFGNPASGGGSLRMWKRFFPRAVFYGVDIFDKTPIREQRVHTVQGDLSDEGFLRSLGTDLGPFDIVIDDGSHRNADVITAFRALFPHVRAGGLYVVEDLQTSYWPGYGGSSERLDDRTTSMGFLKSLLDGLHHEEQERPEDATTTEVERTLTGAHFYRSLAILEKGVNAEGPSPTWIPRELLSYEAMTSVDWGEGLAGEPE